MALNRVISSARGIANQTPVTPKTFGKSIKQIIIHTKVRINEIIADTFPFDKAVKSEDAKIFTPTNK